MEVYIARQPIYDLEFHPYAYELLYRESTHNKMNDSFDGNQATKHVVSDAITVFGLNKLTNGKLAFINFTKELLMSDFPFLMHPGDIVIEILEDVVPDEALIQRIIELKEKGYKIALDDYIGNPIFEPILEYVDIIKVDFMLADLKQGEAIARKFKNKNVKLLAEKIETMEDFEKTKSYGYSLFQGYFFSKPKLISKKTANTSDSVFVPIVTELGKDEPDYGAISKIIELDASLTYRLLLRVNTLRYKSSANNITTVRQAIVRLGTDEFRRWIILMMARSYSYDVPDEVLRIAYVRAVFAERLAASSSILNSRSSDAFMMGMMSMMDKIMNDSMENVIHELPLADDIKAALLGDDNPFAEILQLIEFYEQANWTEVSKFEASSHFMIDSISDCYLECLQYTDNVFDNQ